MTHEQRLRDEVEMQEVFAAMEHERWAKWQRYMHSKMVPDKDGFMLLSPELYERWERQINTPYSELSEQEKESDREQVRPYLEKIREIIGKHMDIATKETYEKFGIPLLQLEETNEK